MDIVYLIKECVVCEELTYSLRSLVNMPHDRVFIVGGCPKNINTKQVIHISIKQTSSNKFQNTRNSLQYICQQPELSENFVLMNDDFFILKPIDTEKDLTYNRGPVEKVLQEYKKMHGTSEYIAGMEQTLIYLKDLGIKKPLSYELHTPMAMSKTNVCKMFSLPYIDTLKAGHNRTIYGNLFVSESEEIADVKVYADKNTPAYIDKFLSCDDISWKRVKTKLETLFPNKSIYEI